MTCLPEEFADLQNRFTALEQQVAAIPAGPQGIQGVQGIQGIQGPAGAQGLPGLPGGQTFRQIRRFGNPLINLGMETYSSTPSTWGRSRAVPAGFQSAGVAPVLVAAPGYAIPNLSSFGAWCLKNPTSAVGSIAYVNPTTGNNVTGQLNNSALPYATHTHAQTTDATIILLEDGIHPPIDYRGAVAKAFICRNPDRVLFRVIPTAGDEPKDATWTATGNGSWYMTYTGNYGGNRVNAVLFSGIRTAAGNPDLLSERYNVGDVDTTPYTFYHDAVNKRIYVNIDMNVQSNRAMLDVLYFTSAGTARHYFQGTSGCIDGGIHWGIATTFTKDANEVFADGFRGNAMVHAAPDHSILGIAAGTFIAMDDNCTVDSALNDGMNGNSGPTGASILIQTRCWVLNSGRYRQNAGGGTANKQAGRSHSGYSLGIGNLYDANFGQEIADTSNTGPVNTNRSWEVGSLARDSTFDVNVDGGIGFGYYGSGLENTSRKALLDTCAFFSSKAGAAGLRLENSATAKLFNCPNLSLSPGSIPGTYEPESPVF